MNRQDENIFEGSFWDQFSDEDAPIDDSMEITSYAKIRPIRKSLLKLNIECSSQMKHFESAMEQTLELVRETIITSSGWDHIHISKTLFGSTVNREEFTGVEHFNTSYSAKRGMCKLYDSIIDCEIHLKEYKDALIEDDVTASPVILFILSEGLDNDSVASINNARDSIQRMKDGNIIVCFFAFDYDGSKQLAHDLGIEEIVETNISIHEMRKVMRIVVSSKILKSS